MLSIQGVSKSYGSHTALNAVSLDIPQKSIFGLLGPNGAGKTSLIRIINQITAPDTGRIFLHGKPMTPRDIQKIGYLPEERGLYPKMKAGEQVIYLARLKGLSKAEATQRTKKWFQKFQMESWWNKNIEELSKGMAQKVQFVATVIHQPDLLIFDEPFTGFDPINTNLIKTEIQRLREHGATIIFSTHRMESVEEICDRIALIHHADKLLEGPLSEIREAYKTNTFHIHLKTDRGATAPSVPDTTRIVKSQPSANGWELQLQLPHGDDPNALVQHLMTQGTLLSFRELIPDLNTIFIQKVSSL